VSSKISEFADDATSDTLTWHCTTELRKFNGDSTDEKDLLEEPIIIEGNSLMYGGSSALWEMLIGDGTATAAQALTYFNNGNAAIGVGDSSTANTLSFTDLQGTTYTTDKIRVAMDATYPLHTDSTSVSTANTITFRATFSTAVANFAWQEWAIFNSATAATGRMLNRAVVSLGTKTSSATWQLTVTLTVS
jgi:hypothetical protein